MSSESKRLLILLGPLIAIASGVVALESQTGSSRFVFAVYAAVAFFLIPPVIQVVLLATQRFGEREFLVCAIGLAAPALLLAVPYLMGLFNAGY
ncbi:MAG TPA: hypothetical protein VKC56_07810 [Gallionellaceae bacterium]|nr:hypothetical protein [Gallionellaceae bacterium]